jgi:hypothetical protein
MNSQIFITIHVCSAVALCKSSKSNQVTAETPPDQSSCLQTLTPGLVPAANNRIATE